MSAGGPVTAGVELRRATVCENLDKSDWVRTVKLLRIGGVYIHDDMTTSSRYSQRTPQPSYLQHNLHRLRSSGAARIL